MPEEAGSRAGDEAGSVFSRSSPASITSFDEASFGTFKEGAGDLGNDKALEPIKDFNGLLKGFVEGQKMIGGSIRVPGKDLLPAERDKAIGELKGKLTEAGILESIPDSPDKYAISFPQIDGWQVNEALHSSFRGAAHKSNMTPSQVQGMFDWYVNFQAESEAAENAEFKAMKEGLKTEWGSLYARKMEAARRAIVKHVGPDADELISELPPATGLKWLKAFSTIGEPMLEDGFVSGLPAGMATRESIQNKINEIQNNKDHPLHDLSKPGHKEAVEENTKLQRALAQFQLDEARGGA